MLSLGKDGFVPSLCSVFQIKEFLSAGGDLCRGAGRKQSSGSVDVGDPSIPDSPRGSGRTAVAVGGDEICG